MEGGDEREIGLLGCGHRGVLGLIGSLKEIGRADRVTTLCDANRPTYAPIFGLGYGRARWYPGGAL